TGAEGRRTDSGSALRYARCRGWGSCRTTWPRHRRRPCTAGRTAPGGPGGDPLLRASGEDTDGSSATGRAVSGVAGPDDAGVEGAGRVPAGGAMEQDSPTFLFRPGIHNTG